jgi:hypothetical protein
LIAFYQFKLDNIERKKALAFDRAGFKKYFPSQVSSTGELEKNVIRAKFPSCKSACDPKDTKRGLSRK